MELKHNWSVLTERHRATCFLRTVAEGLDWIEQWLIVEKYKKELWPKDGTLRYTDSAWRA